MNTPLTEESFLDFICSYELNGYSRPKNPDDDRIFLTPEDWRAIYDKHEEIVNAKVSQALLSERARLVERLEKDKINATQYRDLYEPQVVGVYSPTDEWAHIASGKDGYNRGVVKAISTIKESEVQNG